VCISIHPKDSEKQRGYNVKIKQFYSDTIYISHLVADEADSKRRPKRHQSIKPQTLQITIDHPLEALL
jgi:hypothetical protein